MFTAIVLAATIAAGEIRGLVLLRDDAARNHESPLPGTTITLTSIADGSKRNLVTDQDGKFRATDLPPGEYETRAEMAGLFPQAVQMCVSKPREIVFHLQLMRDECCCVQAEPPPGAVTIAAARPVVHVVSGTVVDGSGLPIRDARVLVQFDKGLRRATTDQEGRFRIRTDSTSQALITVLASSHYDQTVTAYANERDVRFVLQEKCWANS